MSAPMVDALKVASSLVEVMNRRPPPGTGSVGIGADRQLVLVCPVDGFLPHLLKLSRGCDGDFLLGGGGIGGVAAAVFCLLAFFG